MNGLSPVCVLICVFRLPVSENSLRHFSKGHTKTFFSSLGLFTFSIAANDYVLQHNYWHTCSKGDSLKLAEATVVSSWCRTRSHAWTLRKLASWLFFKDLNISIIILFWTPLHFLAIEVFLVFLWSISSRGDLATVQTYLKWNGTIPCCFSPKVPNSCCSCLSQNIISTIPKEYWTSEA